MSIIGGQTVAFIDALGGSPVEIWQVFDLSVHIAGYRPGTVVWDRFYIADLQC